MSRPPTYAVRFHFSADSAFDKDGFKTLRAAETYIKHCEIPSAIARVFNSDGEWQSTLIKYNGRAWYAPSTINSRKDEQP